MWAKTIISEPPANAIGGARAREQVHVRFAAGVEFRGLARRILDGQNDHVVIDSRNRARRRLDGQHRSRFGRSTRHNADCQRDRHHCIAAYFT